jgi:hypothetical protein
VCLPRFLQRRVAEAHREAAAHHDLEDLTAEGLAPLDVQAGPELRPGDTQRRLDGGSLGASEPQA